MRTITTTQTLRDLVRDFTDGKIQLPQFQRDYVWKPRKICNLLDSLLRRFPIGGFYLWRPSIRQEAKPKGFLKTTQIEVEFVGYLIDGQQRLTSLEAAYGYFSGSDKRGAELECFLDLAASKRPPRGRDTRQFVTRAGGNAVSRRVDRGDASLVAIKYLFNGTDLDLRKKTEDGLRAMGWHATEVVRAMEMFDRATQMLDQHVPYTTVHDISDADAVEVFGRLNKGGTQLRQGDVRAAELARGTAVEVLKRMREFVSLERPQRLGFGFSFAFRALVIFHRQSAQFATLPSNWIEAPGPNQRSLRESWEAAERALQEALKFVDCDIGWSRRTLVPSVNAIILLAAAMDRAKFKTGARESLYYRRWLCLTAIRVVFQGSVETTMNRFLRGIRKSRRHPSLALCDAMYKEESKPVEFEELYNDASPLGPITQVMFAWLVSTRAKDWLSGQVLDSLARSDAFSSFAGDLTVHHIFPRKLLADQGFAPSVANCAANFAVLSRSTNSEFGAKPPAEILGRLTAQQRTYAERQFFGEGAGDFIESDKYLEFVSWRAKRIADELNAFLGLD